MRSDKSDFSIYCLVCPIDQSLKYIGCTQSKVQSRLTGHISAAIGIAMHNYRNPLNPKRVSPKNQWLIDLNSNGLRPEIKTIEVVHDPYNATKREFFYIKKYWGKTFNETKTKRYSALSEDFCESRY